MATGQDYLAQILGQRSPYMQGARVAQGFSYRPAGNDIGKSLGLAIAKTALGGVLEGYGRRQVGQQMQALNAAMPSLQADPLGTPNPGLPQDVWSSYQQDAINSAIQRRMKLEDDMVRRALDTRDAIEVERAKASLGLVAEDPRYKAQALQSALQSFGIDVAPAPVAAKPATDIGQVKGVFDAAAQEALAKPRSSLGDKATEEYLKDLNADLTVAQTAIETGQAIQQAVPLAEGYGAPGQSVREATDFMRQLVGDDEARARRQARGIIDREINSLTLGKTALLKGAISEKELALTKEAASGGVVDQTTAAVLAQMYEIAGKRRLEKAELASQYAGSMAPAQIERLWAEHVQSTPIVITTKQGLRINPEVAAQYGITDLMGSIAAPEQPVRQEGQEAPTQMLPANITLADIEAELAARGQ